MNSHQTPRSWPLVVLLVFLACVTASRAAAATPPRNDRFANAITLAGEHGEARVSNAAATAEAGEPRHAGEQANHSVWFRWTAPATASFVFETCGSNFDTLLAVYEGTTLGSLEPVAAADDECRLRSALVVAAEERRSYAIAVDGYDGETGAVVLRWSRLAAPANDAFGSPVALEGTGGEWDGTISGATRQAGEPTDVGRLHGSVWYAWKPSSDGVTTLAVPTTGFDSSLAVYVGDSLDALRLIRANADPEERTSAVSFEARGGTIYRIAVRGVAPPGGGAFTLRWTRPQAPENDRPEHARFVSGEAGAITATTFAASLEGTEQPAHAQLIAGSVWFSWRAPRDGAAIVQFCGGSGPRGITVLAGELLESTIRVGSAGGTCGDARVAFAAEAGTLYRIAVIASRERASTLRLTWGYPTPNDDFAHAEDLGERVGGAVVGTTAASTIEHEEPLPDDPDATGSVWYGWRAPTTGWTTVETCGSSLDTVLAVYSGEAIAALAQLAFDDDSCGAGASRIRFRAERGVRYRITVRGFEGAVDSFRLTWKRSPPPANDFFAAAVLLRGPRGSTAGTTVGTGREPREPTHLRRTTGTAWYQWRATATGWVAFATCGSGFDTVVAAYRSRPLGRLRALDVSDDDCEAGSVVSFPTERGAVYRIVVTGFGRQDAFRLAWHPIAPPACVVPDVVGRPLAEARARIVDAHCRVGLIRVVPLELVRPGTVVGQAPQDQRSIRRPHGTRVRLEVAGP